MGGGGTHRVFAASPLYFRSWPVSGCQQATHSGSSRPSAIECLKFCLNSFGHVRSWLWSRRPGPWPTQITPHRSCPSSCPTSAGAGSSMHPCRCACRARCHRLYADSLAAFAEKPTLIPVIVRHDHWLRLGAVPKRFPTAGEGGDDPQTRRLKPQAHQLGDDAFHLTSMSTMHAA